MADYALTSDALIAFGDGMSSKADPFIRWAALTDRIGPPLLPFVIRPDKFEEIPFVELGLSPFKPSALMPQPGEMWVLFCFRETFRTLVGEDSVLRTDGFPMILEWRKDVPDSPLLSLSFHKLANLVRRQLGIENYGLHPAYARYRDNIAFTDPVLFGDVDDGVSSIASAYGALLAGLAAVASNNRYSFWPFPTMLWDEARHKVCGVGGLKEKFSVAADCGASVVTVVQEQKREAQEVLSDLKNSEGGRFQRLKIVAVGNVANPYELGRLVYGSARRVSRAVIASLGFAACLVAGLSGMMLYRYDWNREKVFYFADYVEKNGVATGLFPLAADEVSKRGRSYRFHFQGYDGILPGLRKRVLRSMWCVNGNGALRLDENDYPEHPPVTGFRYYYNEDGGIDRVDRCGASGRVKNVIRYSGRRAEIGDVIAGKDGRAVSGRMKFASQDSGEIIRRIEFGRDDNGFVTNMVFRRDSSGVSAADAEGFSRLSFDLREDGRITAQRYLNWRGEPVEDSNCVHVQRFFYEEDRLKKIRYYGIGETSALREGKEEERIYVYSEDGNLMQVEQRRAERLLRRVTYEQNEFGDVVRERWFWADGVRRDRPWAMRQCRMDDGGNVESETFYDSAGNKWKRSDDRVATIVRKFSVDGNLVAESLCDENDKLMVGPQGWAIRRIAHQRSDAGYVVLRRYFGEDGKPVLIKDVCIAGEKKTFDEYGRVVGWEVFGTDGEKIDCTMGWQKMSVEYGRDGRKISERFYDRIGKVVKERGVE